MLKQTGCDLAREMFVEFEEPGFAIILFLLLGVYADASGQNGILFGSWCCVGSTSSCAIQQTWTIASLAKVCVVAGIRLLACKTRNAAHATGAIQIGFTCTVDKLQLASSSC